jgi:hypothetical protein
MTEKISHITFNRSAYMDGQRAIWSRMYKGVSGSYIIYMAVTALVLTVGIVVDLRGGFPITTIVAIGMVINIALRFRHVYRVKQAFFNKAEFTASKYENDLKNYTYTFNDYGLTYQDKERAFTFSWPLFEKVTVYGDYLLLRLKEENTVHTVISKTEVGVDDYRDIFNFLNQQPGLEFAE